MTTTAFAMQKIGLTFILGVFQFGALQVFSERTRIRGEYQRLEKDKIGSSTYVRDRPNWESGYSSNNSEDVTNSLEANRNLVLVPQCNPSDSDSFYSQSLRIENRDRTDYLEDTTTDCDRYLEYCDKKRSNVVFSWSDYAYPEEFYDTLELLYDRCFKSCAEYLPGGVKELCSMPGPRDDSTPDFNSASSGSSDYCRSVENSDWTAEMIAHEASVLKVLNEQRADEGGKICTRRALDPSSQQVVATQGFFPRSSPTVTNESLRCAARIQAQNIVKATVELNRFPPNLHTACPNANFWGGPVVCEDFSTRMVNSGYSYFRDGFGYINEVTAAGYQSAEAVIQGWLASTSGHCSAIVKQESVVVPTEVGIGFYRDEASGMTGHVMLLGQRQL
eukprot:CAMPEP_0197182954 /NCGR_PEP_ID=MMETSP1423-20130617/7132_1 /TAXON_ID=476441 /ORGANISM="Pseudo-nitzschia heimii, Strain UNC1101" /LENGTH=389 /DNA_ID=CAMNT_0042633463 /DNA_START=157 /DNA_END=1326 /DNA_ORIENTATION=+